MGYAARRKAQEAAAALARKQEWEELPEAFFPLYWPVADDVAKVRPYHEEPCFCLLCRVKFWYPENYWYIYNIIACPD